MNKSDAPLQLERIGLTIEEAAAMLGIDKDAVRAAVRAGDIPRLDPELHPWLGNRVLIGKRALEAWLTRACLAGTGDTAQPAADRTADAVRRFQRRRSAV